MDILLPTYVPEQYNGYLLMKFTKCFEYQKDFLDGKLFFNTSDFFARCDNEGQSDHDEGNTFIIDYCNPDLMSASVEQIDGQLAIVVRDYKDNPQEYKRGTVWNLSLAENRNRKVISLYTAYIDTKGQTISPFPKNMGKEFGEYGVLILDRRAFFERLMNAIKANNELSQAMLGFVEYLQEKHLHGLIDWNPFRKKPKYCYQNEFRITFLTNNDTPLKLDLGCNLRDIAVPIMADDVDRLYFANGLLNFPLYEIVET